MPSKMMDMRRKTLKKTYKVAIHQPEFLPWCGFFYKMKRSDIFILYDLAQYNKQDFQNRNILCCNNMFKYISVPVQKCSSKRLIKDIKVIHNNAWQKKIKNQVDSYYKKSKFFNEINDILSIIWEFEWESLVDLNIALLKRISKYLGIDTNILLSSKVVKDINQFSRCSASEKNMILCSNVNADIYLSGAYGKEYLDEKEFKNNSIKVEYLDYPYKKEKNYSIVNYLFSEGKGVANNRL